MYTKLIYELFQSPTNEYTKQSIKKELNKYQKQEVKEN